VHGYGLRQDSQDEQDQDSLALLPPPLRDGEEAGGRGQTLRVRAYRDPTIMSILFILSKAVGRCLSPDTRNRTTPPPP
jgi:hypothetical protein